MRLIPPFLAAFALIGCDLKDLGIDTGTQPDDTTTDTPTDTTDDTDTAEDTGRTDDTGDTADTTPVDIQCEILWTSPRTLPLEGAATVQTGVACDEPSIEALFAVVFGMNNTKSDPEVPLSAVLQETESGHVITTTLPEGWAVESGVGDYSFSVEGAEAPFAEGGTLSVHEALSNPDEESQALRVPLHDAGFSISEITNTARLGDLGDDLAHVTAFKRDGDDFIMGHCVEGVCEVETLSSVISDSDGEIEFEGWRWQDNDDGLMLLWWGVTSSATSEPTLEVKPIRLELAFTGGSVWSVGDPIVAMNAEGISKLHSVWQIAPERDLGDGMPGIAMLVSGGVGAGTQYSLIENGAETRFRNFGELKLEDVTWAALVPEYDARDGSIQETTWHIAALSEADPSSLVLVDVTSREGTTQTVTLPDLLDTPDWVAFDTMDTDEDGSAELVVARGSTSTGDGVCVIPLAPIGDLHWGEAVSVLDPAEEVEKPLLLSGRALTSTGASGTGLYMNVDGDGPQMFHVSMPLTYGESGSRDHHGSGMATGRRTYEPLSLLSTGTSPGLDSDRTYVGAQVIPWYGERAATEDVMGEGDLAFLGQPIPGASPVVSGFGAIKELDKSSTKAACCRGHVTVLKARGTTVQSTDAGADAEPLMSFPNDSSMAILSNENGLSLMGFDGTSVIGGSVDYGVGDYWDAPTASVTDTWSIETSLQGFAVLDFDDGTDTSLLMGLLEDGEVSTVAMDNPLFQSSAEASVNALYEGVTSAVSFIDRDDSALEPLQFHEPGWLRVIGGTPSDAPTQLNTENLAGSRIADAPEGWTEGAYEAVMVAQWETGTACPLATVMFSGVESGRLSDNKDNVVVLDTSEDPSCQDLAVPMVSAPLMGEGTLQHVLHKATPAGSDVWVVYRHPTSPEALYLASHGGKNSMVAERVLFPVGSSADLNGDGFLDVLLQDNTGSVLLMSDGEGGFLNEGSELNDHELADLKAFVGNAPGRAAEYQDGTDLFIRKRPGHPRTP